MLCRFLLIFVMVFVGLGMVVLVLVQDGLLWIEIIDGVIELMFFVIVVFQDEGGVG